MKGILLAGGKATRLYPATQVVSKQLLCVYDKPLIFYPLTTLFELGIWDIAIITAAETADTYRRLLGDGSRFGASFTYLIQPEPGGIAQAFLIAKHFIKKESVCLLLGDNIFVDMHPASVLFGSGTLIGAHIFALPHCRPEDFGVVSFTGRGEVLSLEEKPENPKSRYIIPGLYFYDASVIQTAKDLTVSARGELEITDVNRHYLRANKLYVSRLKRKTHWFDAGSPEELFRAAQYIRRRQKRTGRLVGCPEETAYRMGWIGQEELLYSVKGNSQSQYEQYLKKLINNA